jgi:hypothetical protein
MGRPFVLLVATQRCHSSARGGWAGQILTGDGSALPATITLPNITQLDLKVCMMAVFCDEVSYYRMAG